MKDDDDEMRLPPPRTAVDGPRTRKDFEMPDERLGAARSYIRLAEEHTGKAVAALDFAMDAAQRDVVLAAVVPAFSELHSQLAKIEKRLADIRASR